jgi:hypothetical protein
MGARDEPAGAIHQGPWRRDSDPVRGAPGSRPLPTARARESKAIRGLAACGPVLVLCKSTAVGQAVIRSLRLQGAVVLHLESQLNYDRERGRPHLALVVESDGSVVVPAIRMLWLTNSNGATGALTATVARTLDPVASTTVGAFTIAWMGAVGVALY